MNLAADWRGRGVGGLLLDALIEAARGMGAHKAELQVWPHNEPALRLYLSRGFAVEGRIRAHYRRASGQVWDAILMGLGLDRRPRRRLPRLGTARRPLPAEQHPDQGRLTPHPAMVPPRRLPGTGTVRPC